MELAAKILYDGLVLLHARRSLAFEQAGGLGWIQSGLQDETVKRMLFVLQIPLARPNQNGEFAEARRYRALEAKVLADALQPVGEFGAAQTRVERTSQRLARGGGSGNRGARPGSAKKLKKVVDPPSTATKSPASTARIRMDVSMTFVGDAKLDRNLGVEDLDFFHLKLLKKSTRFVFGDRHNYFKRLLGEVEKVRRM